MRSSSWLRWASTPVVALPLLACDLAPRSVAPTTPSSMARSPASDVTLQQVVRQLAQARGVTPLPASPVVRPALAHLGQALLFDRVLSGDRDIACSTCHLPAFATDDGRSLSVGHGGTLLGPVRTHPDGVFIPRNAPPLFNLAQMRHLFWDGRVQTDAAGRVATPAGAQVTPAMQRVFEFGPVSALAMFPVTNRAEMRGGSGTDLGDIPDDDFQGIWAALMRRLAAIPEYRGLFQAAYPGTRFEDMTFAHASNAIGGFIVSAYSLRNTPWDRFLAGDDAALSVRQLEGARTFLTLKCSICHTGATLSDDDFHNVAVAQFGPGQGNGATLRDDFGRMNVTGREEDRYRFRTSPLRNVELTGPYGHDGAISTLRGFIAHYSESDKKLLEFNHLLLEPALQGTMVDNADALLLQRDTLLTGVVITDDLVDRLVDYMSALTDPAARNLSRTTPVRVPSKLTVDRP